MASCGIEVNAVLNLMKILVTPEVNSMKKKDTENEKTDDIFGTVLRNSLQAFWQSLEEEKHLEVKNIFRKNCHKLRQKCNAELTIQTYLEVCQVLLFTLHVVIQQKMTQFKKTEKRELKPNEAPPLAPEILSVNHQKIVLSILQFIAVLGVCPHLQPGVGIPLERRSEFGKLVLESSVFPNKSCQENYVSLLKTVWVLVTCLGSRSLGQIILSRHLGDILAALLQIVHGRQDAKAESGRISVVRETNQKCSDAISEGRKMDTDSGKWTPATMVDMVTQRSLTDSINKTDEIKMQDDSDTSENSHRTQSSKRQEETNTVAQKSNDNDHKLADTKCEEWTMDISFCEESLGDLIKKVHPSLLVRELLMLQGAPGPSFTKKQSVNRKFVLSQSPKWLRRICGRMLSDILMGTDGVINIIKGMLGNVPDDSNVGPPDWRKFDAVAKVISTCPSHLESVEEYYQKISPQILQMLHPKDKQIGRGLLRVACTTISLMSSHNRALTDRYLIQPLCKPLIQSTEHHEMDTDEGGQFIIVDEAEVRDCIEGLHKVFVGGLEPSSPLYICLLPICQPLFELFCFTREGPSHLSSSSQEVLVSVLKNMDPPVCLSVLKFLILQDNIDVSTKSMKILNSNLTFAAGAQGGVVIVTRLQSDTCDTDYNRVVRAMVDILRPLQQTGITGDFLIFTLQELQRIITNEISSEDPEVSEPVSSHHSAHCLLDIEDRQNRELRSYTQKVVVLSVLAQLCEDLGPGCIKSPSQTLKFVQATLERALQICSQSEDEKTGYFESETLTMAMSLLTAMLSGAMEISAKDREDMNTLMPLLNEISQVHTDLSVQEMASDLRIAIATHGVVWSEKLEKTTPRDTEVTNAKESKAKSLIEELSCQPSPDKSKISSDGDKERVKSGLTELGQAMEEICDPLIPVRGHALITMCRLIKKRDPEAVKKQETLLKIFQENLAHLDSYLYLAAVNGLVAMVDIVPDTIIPCLVKEYRDRSSQTEGKSQRSKVNAETRMKVGECLVQTSRNLGDMAPKFRDLLLSTFLMGTKDPDPLIRASSMSNLGEVCSVLKFNLGPIIQEIFTCCSALLKSDPDAKVRKASALTLMFILRGLGHSAIQVLDSVMRDLYQLLKLILRSEKDESVQMQVVLVYNELEDIMREVLFPKQTLQKKIRVRNAEC